MKRLIGLILLIAGIAGIGASYYIQNEVEKGKMQIEDAQGKVDMGRELFSVTPPTDEVGKGLTAPAQKKIDEGRRDVAYYENLAMLLKWGGIVVGIIGLLMLLFGGSKKK